MVNESQVPNLPEEHHPTDSKMNYEAPAADVKDIAEAVDKKITKSSQISTAAKDETQLLVESDEDDVFAIDEEVCNFGGVVLAGVELKVPASTAGAQVHAKGGATASYCGFRTAQFVISLHLGCICSSRSCQHLLYVGSCVCCDGYCVHAGGPLCQCGWLHSQLHCFHSSCASYSKT